MYIDVYFYLYGIAKHVLHTRSVSYAYIPGDDDGVSVMYPTEVELFQNNIFDLTTIARPLHFAAVVAVQ